MNCDWFPSITPFLEEKISNNWPSKRLLLSVSDRVSLLYYPYCLYTVDLLASQSSTASKARSFNFFRKKLMFEEQDIDLLSEHCCVKSMCRWCFRVDLELIQREIGQLSEQYCVKCMENTALVERIATQAKLIESYQTQFKELSTRFV